MWQTPSSASPRNGRVRREITVSYKAIDVNSSNFIDRQNPAYRSAKKIYSVTKIIQDSQNIDSNIKTALTIGNFDGVHLGHQCLIQKTIEIAKKNGLSSAVITFRENSRKILKKSQNLKTILNIDEKIKSLSQLKPDYILVLEFNQDLANFSAREFIQNILIKQCKMSQLVVGEDFALGKNREGDLKTLRNLSKELEFGFSVIKKLKISDKIPSSSLIRELIIQKDSENISKLLGRKMKLDD